MWTFVIEYLVCLRVYQSCRKNKTPSLDLTLSDFGFLHPQILQTLPRKPWAAFFFGLLSLKSENSGKSLWFSGKSGLGRFLGKSDYPWVRAQRSSISSQTILSKGTAYDITKYQTSLTKYEIVCPFKRTLVNSRGTAYHIM